MANNPAAVALGKLRAKTLTRAHQSAAGRSKWAEMAEAERSAEMKRRRRLGVARKARKTRKRAA